MPEIVIIVSKAIIAIFVSLLLNYMYVAGVSHLKKPGDKEILKNLNISWQEKREEKRNKKGVNWWKKKVFYGIIR